MQQNDKCEISTARTYTSLAVDDHFYALSPAARRTQPRAETPYGGCARAAFCSPPSKSTADDSQLRAASGLDGTADYLI